MSDVISFIDQFEGDQYDILSYFQQLLAEEYQLMDKIRYKIPFYYNHSWICYLNPIQQEAIELAFTRGNELSNASGILDFKGRKQVSGVIFSKLSDIPSEAIQAVIQEAIWLDENKPYGSKRVP